MFIFLSSASSLYFEKGFIGYILTSNTQWYSVATVILLKCMFYFSRSRWNSFHVHVSGDQIHLSLSCCPKKEIVVNKLMGLPVEYFWVFVDNDVEFHLCEGFTKFKDVNFTIADEEELTSQPLPVVEYH